MEQNAMKENSMEDTNVMLNNADAQKAVLLSICIVTKNDQENLLRSYDSVKCLIGEKIELVIQDHQGSSRLGSVIKDTNVRITEHSDSGTSDAANIAVLNAKGKYIMFWGAGEQALLPAFMMAVQSLIDDPVDILFNSTSIPELNVVATPNPKIMETDMQCATSGVMFLRDLFIACGGLDASYQIASDYAMFIKMLRTKPSYRVSVEAVVDFKLGGMSSGPRGIEAVIEHELIRMRLCKKNPVLAAMDLGLVCLGYARKRLIINN